MGFSPICIFIQKIMKSSWGISIFSIKKLILFEDRLLYLEEGMQSCLLMRVHVKGGGGYERNPCGKYWSQLLFRGLEGNIKCLYLALKLEMAFKHLSISVDHVEPCTR